MIIPYADDLVLISKSAEGLQKCIGNVCTYCKTCGLDINIKKTKSIVFNSSGRINKTDFKYGNKPTEKGRSYMYLGINFTISSSFTDAKPHLYNRGLKALYKISKCLEAKRLNLKTIIHLFDHTVKPALVYGSEIWGTFIGKKLREGKDKFINYSVI